MANDANMPTAAPDTSTVRGHHLMARVLVGTCIVLLAALATFVLVRHEMWLGGTDKPTASFAFNLTDQLHIDPQLIGYRQIGSIDVNMRQLRGIATGPQDKIYVAGDRAIHIFAAAGDPPRVVNFDSSPLCVVVGTQQAESGRLYVGTSDGIKILSDDYQTLAAWPLPDENAVPTSIAVADDEIFLADAANRVVWRLSATGEVIGQIGKPDAQRQIPGFVIPNPYFDIVAGEEGLLYCVNPGKLQISTYSFDGDLGGSWGRAGSSVADFFGCCNPSHIARFADGRFVTSEKGIPRVKVYTTTGQLESVVAGPQQLGISEHSVSDPRQSVDETVFDVAVDSRGRVLVLDPQTRTVRIFAPHDEELNQKNIP